MKRSPHSVPAAMRVAVTMALSAFAGCSPLPGASLDPVYLKVGSQGGPVSNQGAAPSPRESPRREARTTGPAMWSGRYQDSRGAGDIAVSLVRGESTVSGTWQLRTGGGGALTGVLEAGGRRVQLRMENTAPGCPGLFEGWLEITETVLIGTYQGRDCQGPVSNGRLLAILLRRCASCR